MTAGAYWNMYYWDSEKFFLDASHAEYFSNYIMASCIENQITGCLKILTQMLMDDQITLWGF